jgi:hypothetical protein
MRNGSFAEGVPEREFGNEGVGLMAMLRIKHVAPLTGHRLRLVLTDGTTIERDVSHLLTGPVFEALRSDPNLFSQVRAERGTVVWPGDVDLCPDVLIWNGPPPASCSKP